MLNIYVSFCGFRTFRFVDYKTTCFMSEKKVVKA